MTKAAVAALAVVLTGAAATGLSVAANQRVPEWPAPVVSGSSRTLSTRPPFGRVAVDVRWTSRCLLVARERRCPETFTVRVTPVWTDADGTDWAGEMTEHRGVRDVRRLVIERARPICPERYSFLVRVAAEDGQGVERSRDGEARVPVPCRNLTAAEEAEAAAYRDSFPEGSRRIVHARGWAWKADSATRRADELARLRAATTAAESLRVRAIYRALDTMPDSLPVSLAGDTLVMPANFTTYLCLLGRNRYTGAIAILGGDRQRCERSRAQWASERSG